MILDIYVLSSLVEHLIFSEVNCTLTVTVQAFGFYGPPLRSVRSPAYILQ
jgi:hypothetical protein